MKLRNGIFMMGIMMGTAAVMCAANIGAGVPIEVKQAAGAAGEFHWNWHDAQTLRDDDALRGAKVAKEERHAIADAIEVQLRPILGELGKTLAMEVREASLETRVKLIDLDNDGMPEVIAEAADSCNDLGNCHIWIFKKSGQEYKLILDSIGQTFTVQATSTNGVKDIVVAMRESASEFNLKEYHYEDGKYKRASCHHADWEAAAGQTAEKLKEPRITPCVDGQ
jgi:hypothetical protein